MDLIGWACLAIALTPIAILIIYLLVIGFVFVSAVIICWLDERSSKKS